MTSKLIPALSGAALAAALWQGGQGLYIHAKAQLAQVLIKDAWAESLSSGRAIKPWSWADTAPIARLIVPGHDIDLFVLAGSSGRTLAFGPGHMTGTPLPGAPGRSLIGGHRDTHFRFLKDLAPGEHLIVQRRDGQRFRYKVTGRRIVDHRRHGLAPVEDTSVLSLVTCYPFDDWEPGGPLRYVVNAVPVEETAG